VKIKIKIKNKQQSTAPSKRQVRIPGVHSKDTKAYKLEINLCPNFV